MPTIILPRRCLKRISIFPVLISGKSSDRNICAVLSTLSGYYTNSVWASVFILCEQASGTLFASDSCKTPKILKSHFFNAISVFWLSDDIGEFLVYISIPYSSGLPLGKVSEDSRPRIIKMYTSQDKAASTI